MNSCRVLITGGAGFIGSHLIRRLIARGITCVVIDDLSTGTADNLDQSNPNLTFRRADVCQGEVIRECVSGCDLVVHLAASVGMEHVIEDPLRAISTNVDGVRVVCETAARAGVPLVYVSSSVVYQFQGSGESSNFVESEPLHPSGCHCASVYPETKLLGESICEAFRRRNGLAYLVVRPFNLIGPGQTSRYGMVVPRFVRRVLQGRPVEIHGDGRQCRTFSDVRQAVDLLWRLIEVAPFDGRVVNLAGNDQPIAINDLAYQVMNAMGREAEVVYVPYEQAYGSGYRDLAFRRPNLDRLHELVGEWSPIPLADTLRSIVDSVTNDIKLEVAGV